MHEEAPLLSVSSLRAECLLYSINITERGEDKRHPRERRKVNIRRTETFDVFVTIIAAIRAAMAYGWCDINAALEFAEAPYVRRWGTR